MKSSPSQVSCTEIVLATGNPGKIREFQRLLPQIGADGLWSFLPLPPGVPDMEETGLTFGENARQKALHASRHAQGICLGEDSGLEVDALGGTPGVKSHRFSPSGKDEDNNALLLARLRDVPLAGRTARYCSAVALAKDGEILAFAQGTVEGYITKEPFGDGGFGYDPLFFSTEIGRTFGCSTAHQKDSVSHRRRALQKVFWEYGRSGSDSENCSSES